MNPSTLSDDNFYPLIEARHFDPFKLLGMREFQGSQFGRVLRPDAAEVAIVDAADDSRRFPLTKVHPDGLFEAVLRGVEQPFDYVLEMKSHLGETWREKDAYSFGPVLGEMDIYLFNEGTHYEVYKKLGAHMMEFGGVSGTHFAVWAPNAQRVSVVGDFNRWDGRVHAMRKMIPSGIWEIFVPHVQEGAHYKIEIRGSHGDLMLKTDPFAFFAQHGTQTGCMVYDITRYGWNDADWMEQRKHHDQYNSPMSTYEVHLGSWQRKPEEGNRFLSYIELGDRLIPYVKELGFTHIELLPVMEHPFDGSWGYQVVNFYAPTSRHGNPDEFRNFVDRCHQAGIGVILDWVPGHFPKDAHGLARYDGTCLYEHEDPRLGEHVDWGTLIFNYGRNEVKNFLIGNALFWLDEYHVDGLRVDAVASMLYLDYSRKPGEWVPNMFGGRENLDAIAFMKRCNEVCYERFPGIATIAEESTSWPAVSKPTYTGGLGFGFKWNMGWMNDSLRYISQDPIYRRYNQGMVTFSMVYAFHEHFVLVLSHDEVVHGKGSLIEKMPGDAWQKFANVRMFLAWMWAHPGKKLIFQGIEFGQWREWNHNQSLDWHLTQSPMHDGLRRLVQHLNWLYTHEPAYYELDDSSEGFEWIDFNDSDNSVWSFMRKGRNRTLVFAVNATPVVRGGYRLGVNAAGFYEEILNTDAETYGGSNVGNWGGRHAEHWAWQGKPYSILVDLPPLSVTGFKVRSVTAAPPTLPSVGYSAMPTGLQSPFSTHSAGDGDIIGAVGVLHGLGLDPAQVDHDALEKALPPGQHPILSWRLPTWLQDNPNALKELSRPDLESVVRILGREAMRYRIELRDPPSWEDPEWFAREIGMAEQLRPASTYLYHERHTQAITWQWPLRVGFLNDPASKELYDEFSRLSSRQESWRDKVVRFSPPQSVPANCAIILAPSVNETLPRLAEAGNRLKCGAIIFLDWDRAPNFSGATRRARNLLDATWAGGVAFTGARRDGSVDFFFHFLRAVSHDHAFDRAVIDAWRKMPVRYPIVVGSTTLMRESRLRRLVGRLRRSLDSPSMADGSVRIVQGSGAERLVESAQRPRDISAKIAPFEVSDRIFEHEGDFSTDYAELSEAVEESMREKNLHPEEHVARFIQCKVREGSATPVTDGFIPGHPHQVDVRIGMPDPQWLQPSQNMPFPVEELPSDRSEYELTVVFSPLSTDAIPTEGSARLETKSIQLPRRNGNSTVATFSFLVPEGETDFEARVLVLFENRILQTGRLTGPIGSAAGRGRFERIRFEIESLVNRFFSGLEGGTRFEQALLFNEDSNGGIGVTAIADNDVRISAPQGLREQVNGFNTTISSMAYDHEKFTGRLDQNDDLLRMMIALARQGADLRGIIEKHQGNRRFNLQRPIQVLTKAIGDKIPIEFVYDHEAPKTDARLCPGAPAYLQSGSCAKGHNRETFCPSGFWGLNRVIERHTFSPNAASNDFVLRNEPTESRSVISLRNRALFAGTDVVDNALGNLNGLAKVKAQLDRMTESRCHQVASWAAWEGFVRSEVPCLLVLLVHTEIDPPPVNEQKLEIGTNQWCLYNDIRGDLVGGGTEPGPLLFLIGCKTGDARIGYQTLAEKFKRAGAALVVSSDATIHSAHAVPVLERMIGKLQEALSQRGPIVFGEIMRDMRREMLAEGIPIILCVTAYGDADWALS